MVCHTGKGILRGAPNFSRTAIGFREEPPLLYLFCIYLWKNVLDGK